MVFTGWKAGNCMAERLRERIGSIRLLEAFVAAEAMTESGTTGG